ncbi:MAG: ArsR/SmtB family transcription factor [Phormidesmis sp.]
MGSINSHVPKFVIKASSKTLPKNLSNSSPKAGARDVCQVQCFNPALVNQVSATMPEEELLASVQVLFNALADRSRLKILLALGDGQELCVCDVASLLDVKVSAASHHLRKLRDLKILKHRSDGKLAYYSLADQRIVNVLSHALQQLSE